MSGAGPSSGVRVFISYSRTDSTFVDQFKEDLRKAGATIWIDHESLPAGHPDWQDAIRRGIAASDAFIYVGSPTAAKSGNVGAEVQIAIEDDRSGRALTILPIWAFGEKWSYSAPFELMRYNYLDARDDKYPGALANLRNTLGLHAPPPPRYPAPETPDRLKTLGFRGVNLTGTPAIIPPLITIPRGAFIMGSDKARDDKAQDDERDPHGVELQAYRIGKYPVTVAEYALAVKAGAVREPPTPPKQHEVTWESQLRRPEHPVVCVSWADAMLYALWLDKVTGQQGWRLPTEAEWEKAARWNQQRSFSFIYPWGDVFDRFRCNTHESGVHTTTAVGSYTESEGRSSGASPYGVEDMAGNVWEWTGSVYKKYPYSSGDGREDPNSHDNRTLRGGSWNNDASVARAACRIGGRPDVYLRNVGFRLAAPPEGR